MSGWTGEKESTQYVGHQHLLRHCPIKIDYAAMFGLTAEPAKVIAPVLLAESPPVIET